MTIINAVHTVVEKNASTKVAIDTRHAIIRDERFDDEHRCRSHNCREERFHEGGHRHNPHRHMVEHFHKDDLFLYLIYTFFRRFYQ